MKKLIALLLVMAMSITVIPTCAFAEEGIQLYASAYFDGYGTTLSRHGNGRIKIVFSAFGTTMCDQLGVASYYVEKLDDNGNWIDVSGLLSGRIGSNVSSYTFGRYFNGVAGETYRVRVVFVCVIDNGMETKNYTSGRIKAN